MPKYIQVRCHQNKDLPSDIIGIAKEGDEAAVARIIALHNEDFGDHGPSHFSFAPFDIS